MSNFNARTLILDLFAARGAPTFSTRDLIRAGEVFGLSPTAVRTGIARLKQEKRLISPTRGLYAEGPAPHVWRRRIDGWRQVPDRRSDWSGGWLMAVARQSHMARNQWGDTIRALEIEGFRRNRSGVWLRPDNLKGGVDQARVRLLMFGAHAGLLTARLDDLDSDSLSEAQTLWTPSSDSDDLDAMALALDLSAASLAEKPFVDAARESLSHGRAAVRAIVRDPLLPEALAPTAPLEALIAAMGRYQSVGEAAWSDYLDSPA